MQKKCFGQSFLLKCAVILMFLNLFISPVLAQPLINDCLSNEPSSKKSCREALLRNLRNWKRIIKNLDARILREPTNAALYAERGAVYAGFISPRGNTVEYEKVVYFTEVDKKAFADLNRAIELEPQRVAFYVKRGDAYRQLWTITANLYFPPSNPQFISYGSVPPDFTVWQKIKAAFVNNTDFQNAEKDYRKAVELSPDFKKYEEIYDRLVLLYQSRTAYFSLRAKDVPPQNAVELLAVAMSDFDWMIDFQKKRMKGHYLEKWMNKDLIELFINKSDAAINFGNDRAALEILTEAEKLVKPLDFNFCEFYAKRAALYRKLGEPQVAARDLSTAIAVKPDCSETFAVATK